MKVQAHKIPVNDIYQVTYLRLKKIPYQIEAQGTRVVFLFPNDEGTLEHLAAFNNDALIPVQTFSAEFRKVRSEMVTHRDAAERNQRNQNEGVNYGNSTRP